MLDMLGDDDAVEVDSAADADTGKDDAAVDNNSVTDCK